MCRELNYKRECKKKKKQSGENTHWNYIWQTINYYLPKKGIRWHKEKKIFISFHIPFDFYIPFLHILTKILKSIIWLYL